MKIRNVVFATFIHLSATSLHNRRSNVDIFPSVYQLTNTLVIEASRLCVHSILYAGLQLIHCLSQNVVLLDIVSYEEREEATSGLYGGDQSLPIENAAGASLLQLQCAAEQCHEGQCLMTTFLVARSE